MDFINRIDEWKSKGLNALQLHQVKLGIEKGLTDDQIRIYADPKFDWFQMEQIRLGLEAGMDVSIYAQPNIPSEEMEHIRQKNEINAQYSQKVKQETKALKKENQKRSLKLTVLITALIGVVIFIALAVLFGWNHISLWFDEIQLIVTVNNVQVDYGQPINLMDYIDEYDERYPLEIMPDSVDTDKPGITTVVIQQSNGVKTETENIQITVVDKVAPIIELSTNEIYTDGYDVCKSLVVSAYDEIDGDLLDQVQCNDDLIFNDEGQAEMTYEVSDSSGNQTIEKIIVKQIPQCGANASWDGTACVCNAGFEGDPMVGCTAIVIVPPTNTNNDWSPSWDSSSGADQSWDASNNAPVTEWSEWEVVEEETWSSSSSTEYSEDVTVTWDE